MGMSASQMRYCLISGRKSDVEFQGQQINQQRTTLATQSSAYNTQLLNLNVPTPPSTDEYTTTNYSFAMNGNTYQVTGTTYDATTGKYSIDTLVDTTKDTARTGLATFYSITTGTPAVTTYSTGTTAATKTNLQLVDVSATSTASAEEIATDKNNMKILYGAATAPVYKYTSAGKTRYVTLADLTNPTTGANTGQNTTFSYVEQDAAATVSSKISNATIAWSETGRMTAIIDENKNEYKLNVTTETDDKAYDDAMNEYEYQKNLYDQSMDQINAQVCVIESQDKKLELKLKDLDTQQEALNTEMDAVKKVIDKNIEVSFKAFG